MPQKAEKPYPVSGRCATRLHGELPDLGSAGEGRVRHDGLHQLLHRLENHRADGTQFENKEHCHDEADAERRGSRLRPMMPDRINAIGSTPIAVFDSVKARNIAASATIAAPSAKLRIRAT